MLNLLMGIAGSQGKENRERKWGRSPVKYLFCDKNYFCFLRGILPSAQVKIGMWLLPRFMM